MELVSLESLILEWLCDFCRIEVFLLAAKRVKKSSDDRYDPNDAACSDCGGGKDEFTCKNERKFGATVSGEG